VAEFPAPDSDSEREAFRQLQRRLPLLYTHVFPDLLAPRTVVVVPSLSLDAEELVKITGVHHYEERMLCMLMLLRLPRTRVVFVSSRAIAPTIIDYYLHLLSGIPSAHARARLHLFSCDDGATDVSLTRKVLDRPRLIARMRKAIPDPDRGHLACFNATALERALAVRLGIPLYACDPALTAMGNKSGSRAIFRDAGVDLPEGREDLRDEADIADALVWLKRERPTLARAVVKLNEGFSGEGNAVFRYDGAPDTGGLARWVRDVLPERLAYEASGETWDRFRAKFSAMRGVVERFIDVDVDGADGPGDKRSPSVQCRINPLGHAEMISTHDQVLGGPSGQVFLGATFPADEAYRMDIQRAGEQIARVVAERGALGRFGIDFVSVFEGGRWRHYAIEINLRKGGTTHPFMMLQYLTDGRYDVTSGQFFTPAGQPRYYRATDNLHSERYRGLLPQDLIDITVCHRLHFHGATQTGVVFHLLGGLSEFGKLGMVCISDSPAAAERLYAKTVAVLDREAQAIADS
jgi:hypothetical protein